MGSLFKISLIHLKKNIPMTLVLGTFMGFGTIVLSSSDNLLDNLNRGFEEINRDSNPHDLILVNKHFKPSQQITLNNNHIIDLDRLDISVKHGYKWSFVSNRGNYFVKKGNTKKLSEGHEKGQMEVDPIIDAMEIYPEKGVFVNSDAHKWMNNDIVCMDGKNFLASWSKVVVFSDPNKSGFLPHLPEKVSESRFFHKEDRFSYSLQANCPWENSSEYQVSNFYNYFLGILKFFERNVVKNLDSDAHDASTEQGSEMSLNEDEKYEVNREAFNPQKFYRWQLNNDKKIWSFRPLLEKDYYLSFNVPFAPNSAGLDIIGKFKELVRNIKNSSVFNRLDEITKQSIELFSSSDFFNEIVVKYYISSLGQELSDFTSWVPLVPGMSYRETIHMLTKLILWPYLNQEEQIGLDIASKLKWNGEKKTKLKAMIDSWEEPNGIGAWNPFSEIDYLDPDSPNKTIPKPFEKSQDYIFSVLKTKKKISELKGKGKYNQEYGGYAQAGGTEKQATWCSSNCNQDDEKTLFGKWKEILKAWIDGNYHTEDDRVTGTSESKLLIPALNSHSYSNKQRDSSKGITQFFQLNSSTNSYDYFRAYPDSFEDFYGALTEKILTQVKNYLLFITAQTRKEMRKFVSDHNIFTLSFLLYNFRYIPQGNESSPRIRMVNGSRESAGMGPAEPMDDDSWYPSVNYHKSLVVSNLNSSAKFNDGSKIGHSFKVITRETKDKSSLNRIKIISGNPLFESKYDYSELIKRINLWREENVQNKYPSSYEFKDIFNLLSRAKYTNPEYPVLFKALTEYVSHPHPDTWNDNLFIKKEGIDKLIDYIKQLESYAHNLKIRGSKILFDFHDFEYIPLFKTIPLASKTNTFVSTGYIDQFSSVFALVSPFYAQKHNIRPISNEQYENFRRMVESDTLTQEDWEKEYHSFLLNPDNHDHILNINGNSVIIVGTAMTPDMAFPTHSLFSLIPDKEREALIFMNEYGYRNIKYNSPSLWNEFYLSISYPQKVKDLKVEDDYFRQLNSYINNFLGGDEENISQFDLRRIEDINLNSLVSLRSNYVSKFTQSISLLSYSLLGFMGVIILFTVWTLIRKYISSSLNTFGVFVANGTTRLMIMLNSFAFVLIPAAVGVFLGYIVALALQPLIFGLFSNVWYLTPIFNGFSLPDLLHYILLSGGLLVGVSLLSSYRLLSPGASQLMRLNVSFKQSKFIKKIYDLFSKASPLWRFRISIILNTLNKGFILSTSTVFLFVFCVFLFNNYGQFQKVSDLELAGKHYGYDIALTTPTEQSGQYFLSSYKNLGETFLNNISTDKKVLIRDKNVSDEWKIDEVKISKDNPELIGTGIQSPFLSTNLSAYMEDCRDKTLTELNKDLNILNLDYPPKLFFNNPYNLFFFKSKISRKSDDKAGCSIGNYKKDPFLLPTPFHETSKLFYTSAVDGENAKFRPALKDENVRALLQLGDYVPVKQELWKKDAADGPEVKEKEMEKFGDEPLFKPLMETYRKKIPLLKNNVKDHTSYGLKSWDFTGDIRDTNEEGQEIMGDYRKLEDQYHPTLSRLFRDHSNYWLFTFDDLEALNNDPIFFKNKVILPILFNHNWTFNLFGKSIEVNPWHEFNDFFSKYSPEMVSAVETNYAKFVESIINSRYGEYFVTRFMNKHDNDIVTVDYFPGKEYNGRRTWKVEVASMKKPTNGRAPDLEDGYYWFNPSKIVYLYHKLLEASRGGVANDEGFRNIEKFIIFRPDFLYLFYALMEDEEFLKEGVAPIKITFNQNLYVPDYGTNETSSTTPFRDEFTISGDPDVDRLANKGLVSSDPQNANYEKIPNGDQTYTYLRGDIDEHRLINAKVVGLKQDSRGSYVVLRKDSKVINHKLYEKVSDPINNGYPVIVNHYTARRLGVGIGSTFTMHITNTFDRYTKKFQGMNNYRKKVKMRVVDIYDSYYQNSFFISQENANKIIGLNGDYGYNALFTKAFEKKDTDKTTKLPHQFANALSAYSESGIYSSHTINRSSIFLNFLKSKNNGSLSGSLGDSIFPQPENYRRLHKLNGVAEEVENASDFASILEKIYGVGFVLAPSVTEVMNVSLANNFIFHTANDLVVSVVNMFISVLAPLLVCALLIITNLMVDDLKNLLTILNLLGFTYLENSVTILLYLGLVLGVSTLISLPISAALLSLYVNTLFENIAVYLPIYLRFDYVLYCFLILLGMFGISYLKSMKKIKSLYLPMAMKGLNE